MSNCFEYAGIPSLEVELFHEIGSDQGKSVKARYADIPLAYLSMDGSVKSRDIRIYMPIDNRIVKFPVILSSHYVLEQFKVYNYIIHGYAVVTPVNIPPEHLQNITADALRFSMGALDFVRRLPYIDITRIALRGESAAGYHTLMLSATHLGINCAYDLFGGVNNYYQYRYAEYNNRYNIEFEENSDDFKAGRIKSGISMIAAQKNNWTIYSAWGAYPIPFVKGLWDIMIAPSLQQRIALDHDTWRRLSFISYIDWVCNPILMFHSSADALVPMNAISERYAYQSYEDDLPEDMIVNIHKLVDDEYLNKPMEELVPEGDMEVFRLNPLSMDPSIKQLRFTPGKKFSLNYIDEGRLNRKCDHSKDPKNLLAVSEMDFLKHYMNTTADMTNRLTFSKVRAIVDRYRGQLDLLKEENTYKKDSDPHVLGSLDSDRLDVLLGIKVYLNLEYEEEKFSIPVKKIAHKVRYNSENLRELLNYYTELEPDYRVFGLEPAQDGLNFIEDPINCLIWLIEFYRKKCC